MTDKPIIFSAPMVRALIDGRKAQTRRCGARDFLPSGNAGWNGREIHPLSSHAPGDRLYVREAWRSCVSLDALPPREIGDRASEAGYKAPWGPVFYEADGAVAMWPDLAFTDTVGRYRHAHFMPRWASRLTLTVTDVRVQRLQEISNGDASDEGVEPNGKGATPIDQFRDLWNSLHGPESWDRNDWVAALTFDVHSCNIDQMEARR